MVTFVEFKQQINIPTLYPTIIKTRREGKQTFITVI